MKSPLLDVLLQLLFLSRRESQSARIATWRTRLAVVAAIAIGCVTFARLASLAKTVSRHIDEWGYVVSSVHYIELVAMGDFTSREWEGENLGGFGSLNPHAGQLWIGLWLKLNPATRHVHFSHERQRQFLVGSAWELLPDDAVPKAVLYTARLASAASGALCIMLVFSMVYRVAGIAPGLIAAALANTLPPFEDVLCRVFADGIYNLGLLAATWALAEMAVFSRKPPLWLAVVAGAAFGIAFNAKITALAVGFAVTIAVALSAARLHQVITPFAVTIRRFAVVLFVAVVTAGAINPYFWPTAAPPPDGGRIRAVLPAALGGEFPYPPSIESHGPVALRLWEIQIRWQRHLLAAADVFESQKVSALQVLRRIFSTYNHHRPGFVAAVLALGYFAFALYRRRTLPARLSAFIVTLTVHILFLCLVQPLDWNRYYLPAILHLQVAIAAIFGCAVIDLLTRQSSSDAFP